MEENNIPNPEQNNVAGKKKKMGPVKGLLLAVLIVFLMCVIGLLIRVVVADDGDYFKPIKDILGIEDEKDNKKDDDNEEKETLTSSSNGSTSLKSGARYTLLSDDTEENGVQHYRLTVDMKKMFKTVLSELNSLDNDENNYNFDDNDDFNFDDDDNDYDNDDFSFDFNDDNFAGYGDDEDFYFSGEDNESDSISSKLEGLMSTAMVLVSQMGDMIDGEMYFDIYFEGNEIVQVIFGYDYEKFAQNMYEYILENAEDSLENEDIDSYEDFLEYINEQIKTMLDEDKIYDELMESSGKDVETQLSQFGIKKKDIKDAIDFYCDNGIFEVYINGTTKIKALLSMALESDEFQKSLEDLEDEQDIEIDEDNVIESMLKAANKSDDYADLGLKFVKVK